MGELLGASYGEGKTAGLKDRRTAKERERQLAVDVKQELLECRICLNPGVRRKCCGGCICDACYNRKSTCPACGEDAAKRGLGSYSLRDPGLWPVLCGWCLTLFVVAFIVGATFFVMRVARGRRCLGREDDATPSRAARAPSEGSTPPQVRAAPRHSDAPRLQVLRVPAALRPPRGGRN